MPCVDVYAEAVVISIHVFTIKTNQLTGNVYNHSEVTIKAKEDTRSCYAKYVFLLGKNQQRDQEPSPFGPFY